MRLQTVIGVALCGALGLACGGGPGVVAPPDNHQAPFADLGQRKAVLSGVVYDPEAFFYSLAMFPQDPEHPEQTPPPALLSGIPYLLQSALPNTRVAVMDGTTQAVASPPSTPTGDWQAIGVPGHDEARFELFATPPTGELNLGADFFPSPPFAAVPTARYFPTRTLKTVLPARTYCFD
ncbi:MAG TPA: hypothetical protein VK447_15680, partial [Myxococcaceae bacterium]|nr:hypothetical protein [Myxococcaceae bacterium]